MTNIFLHKDLYLIIYKVVNILKEDCHLINEYFYLIFYLLINKTG